MLIKHFAMKNYILTGLFLLMVISLQASQLRIIIISLPENTPPGDEIFIAGSFNQWNPGNPDFILQSNNNGQPEIVLEGSGTIQFKFTRGSWETVEGGENGGYIPDRNFTFGSADMLEIIILSWEDLGPGGSTAAENVIVMDDNFYMPQLNRYRRIWLYLPPDYETSGKDYPVLYMHDGQNLFDLYTSFAGEWEVDETLNALFGEGKEVPIVVGIDNGGAHRLDEYSPWVNAQYGGGEGDLYAQFIIETLKPYVDENYRTRPERAYTGVMGSSLGALISHYMVIKYQEVFGIAGVFSPSFWFSDSCYSIVSEMGSQHPVRYYLMGGTNESGGLTGQMEEMMQTLLEAGFDESQLQMKIVQGGQHNEQLWRTQFGEAYEWMFAEDAASTSDNSPNTSPVKVINRRIFLESETAFAGGGQLSVQVFSLAGRLVFSGEMNTSDSLTIPKTLHGIFLLKISKGNLYVTKKVFLN
jgi:predicted alpha/beta superfamily hydrolase